MIDEAANDGHLDPTLIKTRQDFAVMLTAVRVEAGYTVRDLAKAVHIPFTTLGGYLRGRHLPTVRSSGLLPTILRACGVTDPSEIRQWQAAWNRVRQQPGVTPRGAPVPYLGLSNFQASDAEWFYGRDALIDIVIDRLATQCVSGGMTILVGASGSGKSSLLQAGMIPALRAGELPERGSTTWPVMTYTPGKHPLQELANALTSMCTPPSGATPFDDLGSPGDSRSPTGPPNLQAALATSPSTPLDQVTWTTLIGTVAENCAVGGDQTSPHASGPRRVVIIVDQFEELFALCQDKRECQLFVDTLDAATRRPGPSTPANPPALVVLGLRADFYAHALQHPPLVRAMQDSQVLVGPMTETELRQVIVEPAAKANLTLEDGLTELLLRDVAPLGGRPASVPDGHDVGALPLLSHALWETWQLGQHRRLTVAAYRQSGGIAGAVARTAEAVYEGLSPRQQELACTLFLRLVNVGDDVPDTRRRIRRGELEQFPDAADIAESAAVLDQFIGRRLITTGVDTVEIAHEAVLRAWPRLHEWIDANRASLLVGQQLHLAAESWLRDDRDPAALLQGSRLAAAREWQAGVREATLLAREFLAASIHRERRGVRRLRQTVTSLCVLLLLTVTAGLVAVQQTRSARAERNTAISRLVATRADRLRAKDIPLSMQLSLIAYQIAHTPEARSSLLDSSAVAPATRLLGSSAVMQAVAFRPDRRVLAAGSADRSIRLWNVADPQHPVALGPPLTGPTDVVYSVAFSPDGRTLAAGSGDTHVWRWDVSTPARPAPLGSLSGPEALIYSVAFSPDGATLAAGSGDKRVWLWNVHDPHHPDPLGRSLSGARSYVESVAFSPDGAVLAAGSDDHTTRLWSMRAPGGPAPLGLPLAGAALRVYAVAFSPDGATLAVGSADRAVYLWDVRDPARPRQLPTKLTGPTSWVNTVAFSPDGRMLALGSADDTLRLWDIAGRRYAAVLPHPGPVTGIAFGEDQNTVATSAADGEVRVWHLPASPLTGAGDTISGVAHSPVGHILAVASAETRLWDLSQLRPLPVAMTNASGFSGTVDITPDGHTAAVSAHDGSVQLWNVADPQRPTAIGRSFMAHDQLIESLAFGHQGQLLATGSDDNTVRLWDTSDPAHPALLARVGEFRAYVYSVRFSPNGRLLAAASVDDSIRIWDVSDVRHPLQLGAPLTNPDHYQLCIAFSPDGRTLAVGSADNTVRLWNVTNPHHPTPYGRPLAGPSGYVYALSFAPDGRTLAAANTDSTVWLWNVTDPALAQAMATLTAATGSLYSVAYSPDGQTLAAGGAARSVWVWDTSTARAAARVCAETGSPITRAEWAQYVPGVPYQPPCSR